MESTFGEGVRAAKRCDVHPYSIHMEQASDLQSYRAEQERVALLYCLEQNISRCAKKGKNKKVIHTYDDDHDHAVFFVSFEDFSVSFLHFFCP